MVSVPGDKQRDREVTSVQRWKETKEQVIQTSREREETIGDHRLGKLAQLTGLMDLLHGQGREKKMLWAGRWDLLSFKAFGFCSRHDGSHRGYTLQYAGSYNQ